jgi:hypothetical protein
MKITYVILCVLVAMLTGLACAQGDVYTTGGIYVATTPPAATALLDGGTAYLYTPGTFSALPPGDHSIIIAKPGYQTIARNVTVVIGETKNLIVTLDQAVATGSVSVSTTPKGAQLYIDGISQGKTDQIVGNLASGSHLVTLTLAGFVTWSQMVTVKSGETTTVTATLVAEVNPTTGDLRVSSTPSGAAVYVNGNFVGTTPADSLLDVTDLTPGTATVVLKKSGYQDYSTMAVIEAGKLVQVFATLQPGTVPPPVATAEITSTPSGANVYINNVFTGITPLTFQNVNPGTYSVEIRLDGYTPYSTTGQVVAGQNIRIAASLAPVATPTTTKAPVSPVFAIMALIGGGIIAVRVSRRE